MIIEQEVIEQIEEEPAGRALSWLVDFMRKHGVSDPMRTLGQMWRAEYLALVDAAGAALPRWRCEELWRAGLPRTDVAVMATQLGSAWVHG